MAYFDWIKKDNDNQVRWAINYLITERLHFVPRSQEVTAGSVDWKGLERRLFQTLSTDELVDLKQRMKGTWARQKSRKKDEKTASINLSVDRSIRAKFNALASQQKMTQAECFTDLVLLAETFEAEKREAIEALKAEYKQKKEKSIPGDSLRRKDNEIKKLKDQISLLQSMLPTLAYEMSEAEARYEAQEAGEGEPTPERLQQARDRADRMLRALRAIRPSVGGSTTINVPSKSAPEPASPPISTPSRNIGTPDPQPTPNGASDPAAAEEKEAPSPPTVADIQRTVEATPTEEAPSETVSDPSATASASANEPILEEAEETEPQPSRGHENPLTHREGEGPRVDQDSTAPRVRDVMDMITKRGND